MSDRGTIVVTGGSRGIGAATALLAGRRGYGVCVNYVGDRNRAHEVVAKIEAAGSRAIAVRADVSRPSQTRALFDAATSELGPVTALVNNAGISGGRTLVADLEPAVLRAVFEVNVLGAFFSAHEAIRHMSTERGGRGGGIVNVSSLAARSGGLRLAHYAASKAALEAFTVSLSREVADQGIRVNAVAPGVIATDQNDLSDPERAERMKAAIPMKRIGTPEEVAQAILWLLSGEASYVTGAVLHVTGGR